MKVSYVEGVANHNDLESCGAARKGGVEALTEEHAGGVLSREIMTLLRKQQALQGADALEISGICPVNVFARTKLIAPP